MSSIKGKDLIRTPDSEHPINFGMPGQVCVGGKLWTGGDYASEALKIGKSSVALERLGDDERAKFNLGRQGETNVVNESGLYTLVLGSRKPEAKAFKRWITHEVIPSIRKHDE